MAGWRQSWKVGRLSFALLAVSVVKRVLTGDHYAGQGGTAEPFRTRHANTWTRPQPAQTAPARRVPSPDRPSNPALAQALVHCTRKTSRPRPPSPGADAWMSQMQSSAACGLCLAIGRTRPQGVVEASRRELTSACPAPSKPACAAANACRGSIQSAARPPSSTHAVTRSLLARPARFRPLGPNLAGCPGTDSQAFSYIPQRSAAVCNGASHSASVEGSAAQMVIEQPAISNDVT
jgi:hypothetical protein